MGIAQPAALLFLGLGVPIVLLYLLRQRRRRIPVSTLLFFEQVIRDEEGAAKLSRLRKILSLLLQLLFVALLTLALSRPYLSQNSGEARRVVVFVDVSASMMVAEAGGSRLELARTLARNVFRGMSTNDVGMLVEAGPAPRVAVPLTAAKDALVDGADSLAQSQGPADLRAALAVLDHLPEDDRETSVYWITDDASDWLAETPSNGFEHIRVPVGGAKDNMGIISFSTRPLPGSLNDVEILVEAVNETSERQRVPYELRVNGDLADVGEWTFEPGAHRLETLRQYNPGGGKLEFFVEFEDAFPLDNRAYAVLPTPTETQLLLVTEGNLFLESALRTLDGVEIFLATPEKYEEIYGDGNLPPEIEMVVFDRAEVRLAPNRNSVYIGGWPQSLLPATGELERPAITDWVRDHPVLANLTLSNVSVQRALRVDDAEGWETLVYSFEDPLVLLRERGGVRQLLLSFEIGSTDLPLRTAFPILIANVVRYMTADHEGPALRDVPVGTAFTLDDLRALSPELAKVETVALTGPGRRGSTILADHTAPFVADRVGIYSFQSAEGEDVPLFAVNLNDGDESRMNPPQPTGDPGNRLPAGGRYAVQPWSLLAALGLVLILVEWVLFQRRWVE